MDCDDAFYWCGRLSAALHTLVEHDGDPSRGFARRTLAEYEQARSDPEPGVLTLVPSEGKTFEVQT